jgi:hypothetical protein
MTDSESSNLDSVTFDYQKFVEQIQRLGRDSKDHGTTIVNHMLNSVDPEKTYRIDNIPSEHVPSVEEIQGHFIYGEAGTIRWIGADPDPEKTTVAPGRVTFIDIGLWIGRRHYPIRREEFEALEFGVHLFRQRKLLHHIAQRR